MIARILKAALIAWVGKKLLTGGSSQQDEAVPPKAVRRTPARRTGAKAQPARRRAA